MSEADIKALIWDVDGVIVYVGDSYRKAIVETTEYYFKDLLDLELDQDLLKKEDTQRFKLASGFNNDWEITYGAILCYLAELFTQADAKEIDSFNDVSKKWDGSSLEVDIKSILDEVGRKGGGLQKLERVLKNRYGSLEGPRKLWDKSMIKQVFQEMYLGDRLYVQKYGNSPKFVESEGLIRNETPLVNRQQLSILSDLCEMGIASGREHFEIKAVLDMHNFTSFFDDKLIVGSDDFHVGKPDPGQLLECRKRIDSQGKLDNDSFAYIGDVPDDVVAAKRAGFTSVGCSASLKGKEKRDLERRFRELEADYVIDDLDKLIAFI